jgi:hypothetical protein
MHFPGKIVHFLENGGIWMIVVYVNCTCTLSRIVVGTVHVDSNLKQITGTVHVDSNLRQSWGTVHVDSNTRQSTGTVHV